VADSVYSLDSYCFGFRLLDLRERNEQLFLYEYLGHNYVLRPLYLSEIESITKIGPVVRDYVIDEWILERTLLATTASKEYLTESGPAGVVAILATSVIKVSSPGDIIKMSASLEQERQKLEADNGIVQTTMLAGTGNILGKGYKQITAREQSKYLAIAETILGKKLEVQSTKQVTDKKGRKRQISPETAAMLSAQAADKPDIESDNKMFRAL
jgi:hypothetical protein